MTSLAAVHAVLPPHRYPQDKITEAFAEHVLGAAKGHEVVRRIHTNTRVGSRYLALPLEQYKELTSFTDANNAYLEVAVDLAVEAIGGALQQAGIAPATQPRPNSGTRLMSGRNPSRPAIRASSEGTPKPVTVVEKMTSTSSGAIPAC